MESKVKLQGPLRHRRRRKEVL